MEHYIQMILNDPIVIIILSLILLAILFFNFRIYLDNILYNLILEEDDDDIEENNNLEELVCKFTTHIYEKLINISTKVKRRKTVIILLAKVVNAKFTQRYLLKMITQRNPNKPKE